MINKLIVLFALELVLREIALLTSNHVRKERISHDGSGYYHNHVYFKVVMYL